MPPRRKLFTRLSTWGSLAISISAGRGLPATDFCVLGPVYLPAASALFLAFSDAKSQALTAIEDGIVNGNGIYGPVDGQRTCFSVQIFIWSYNEPRLDYHFEAPELVGSAIHGTLSENTVYRSGSLGKLMTVYIWLVDIGDEVFLDPITKYLVGGSIVKGFCGLWFWDSPPDSVYSLNLSRLLNHTKTLSGLQTGLK